MASEDLADGLVLSGRDGPCNVLNLTDNKTSTHRRLLVPDRAVDEIRAQPRDQRVKFVLDRWRLKNWQCNPLAEAFANFIRRELERVGRPNAVVESGTGTTITISDTDGRWSGPGPAAQIALGQCPDGRGAGSDFWDLFPQDD